MASINQTQSGIVEIADEAGTGVSGQAEPGPTAPEDDQGQVDKGTAEQEKGSRSFFQKMRENGTYSIYNPHSEGFYKFFSVEPYVLLLIGIFMSIAITVSNLANKEDPTKPLCIIWIMLAVWVFLSTALGLSGKKTYFSD